MATGLAGTVVCADPAALRAVRRVGVDASWELTKVGRRLSLALTAAAAAGDGSVPAWAAGLGDELVALADAWEALDSWTGQIGDAVARADTVALASGPVRTVATSSVAAFVEPAPTWVDALSDTEAEAAIFAAARQLRPFAPFLTGARRVAYRDQLAPLVRRVRRRWPSAVLRSPSMAAACRGGRAMPKGLDDAIDLLLLPGPGRAIRDAGVVEAAVSGFANGAGDTAGYDTLGAEIARTTGHVASGVLVFGDIRDGVVEASRGNGWGVAAAVGGLVPGAGDAFKGAKSAGDLADAVGDLRKLEWWRDVPLDLAKHDEWGGHGSLKHIGLSEAQLAQRLIDEPKLKFASSFTDDLTTRSAVRDVLESNTAGLAAWRASGEHTLVVSRRFEEPIGLVMPRGAPAAPGYNVSLVLRRSTESPTGWYIHTMKIDP